MAKRRKTSAKSKRRAPGKRALALKRSQAAKRGWITRRANARKRKSRRRPEPHKSVEYAVNVNYRVKGQHNAISVQFSVIAPPNLTAHQVQEIIIATIESEGESPDGTTVRIINWKGGRVPHEIPWSTLAIIASEPATRFRVSQSRSRA